MLSQLKALGYTNNLLNLMLVRVHQPPLPSANGVSAVEPTARDAQIAARLNRVLDDLTRYAAS